MSPKPVKSQDPLHEQPLTLLTAALLSERHQTKVSYEEPGEKKR